MKKVTTTYKYDDKGQLVEKTVTEEVYDYYYQQPYYYGQPWTSGSIDVKYTNHSKAMDHGASL